MVPLERDFSLGQERDFSLGHWHDAGFGEAAGIDPQQAERSVRLAPAVRR